MEWIRDLKWIADQKTNLEEELEQRPHMVALSITVVFCNRQE